jgi:hypothetical protein
LHSRSEGLLKLRSFDLPLEHEHWVSRGSLTRGRSQNRT